MAWAARTSPPPTGVRALLGETEDSAEDVLELACNLDDMTPEATGFALERLLEAGRSTHGRRPSA